MRGSLNSGSFESQDFSSWDDPLYEAPLGYPGKSRKELVISRLKQSLFINCRACCSDAVVEKIAREMYREVERFVAEMTVDFMTMGQVPDEEEYLISNLSIIFAEYGLDFAQFVRDYLDESESTRVWIASIQKAFRMSVVSMEMLN
ncbi:MAG: hypothetical protein ABII07_03525 [Patescibacteria group bacterium]|nr:hypothetical protein [Patescibacteria group bacterium]